MNLPLFPLHTVLCPGVALPLHVFEARYKVMVERCLADDRPFGVVLIREGREAGPGDLAVAGVGTLAEIQKATRYPDGRFDLVTMGTQRFRLDGVDPEAEPYLVGQITPMGEVLGESTRAKLLSERVLQRFIRYLELLQVEAVPRRRRRASSPADASDAAAALTRALEAMGEAWVIDAGDLADAYADLYEAAEREAQAADPPGAPATSGALDHSDAHAGGPSAGPDQGDPIASDPDGSAAQPVESASTSSIDDTAIRGLAIPDDPTVLSYLLSGIVQVALIRRQGLLEMPTTESRLVELAHLLEREIALLDRGLGTYTPDPRLVTLRRN